MQGSVVSFESTFPYSANMMNGLTIAAVAVGSNFTLANNVTSKTLFGPGLIEIN